MGMIQKCRDLGPSFALNADSAQHAAILEVAEGKDLVIEWPPGTGKSQTIVNLISNALYPRKTVLFLAQTLAALEVVNHRLESIGLGKSGFTSLHSEYARKSTLFESIGEKIKAPVPEGKVSKSQFSFFYTIVVTNNCFHDWFVENTSCSYDLILSTIWIVVFE